MVPSTDSDNYTPTYELLVRMTYRRRAFMLYFARF